MGQFKPEPKMKTTEPSVELKMKKGSKAKMADGGMPMADERMPMRAPMRAPMRTRNRMPMQSAMSPAMSPAMMARKNGGKTKKMNMGGMHSMPDGKMMMNSAMKKGGEVESPKMHKSEMKQMGKIEKELKHHESMKASKAHKGLKSGGMYRPTVGGLLSEGKPHGKGTTGGIEGTGYKNGGALKPKINVQDKVVTAKQTKSFNTKSGGVEGVGYKMGGTVPKSVASRYVNNMKDGSHPTKKVGKTGSIKQAPAGYKDGGHVAMSCKDGGGFTAMKKMSKC
jgi:hypothetical protein